MNKRMTVDGDSPDDAKKKALATAGLVGKYGNAYRNSAKKEKDLRDSLSRNEFKNIPGGAGKDRLINTTKDLMDISKYINHSKRKTLYRLKSLAKLGMIQRNKDEFTSSII